MTNIAFSLEMRSSLPSNRLKTDTNYSQIPIFEGLFPGTTPGQGNQYISQSLVRETEINLYIFQRERLNIGTTTCSIFGEDRGINASIGEAV